MRECKRKKRNPVHDVGDDSFVVEYEATKTHTKVEVTVTAHNIVEARKLAADSMLEVYAFIPFRFVSIRKECANTR